MNLIGDKFFCWISFSSVINLRNKINHFLLFKIKIELQFIVFLINTKNRKLQKKIIQKRKKFTPIFFTNSKEE